MPAMRTFIAAALVGLSSLPSVIAWGSEGHKIVATLAQSHLDPRALSAVCSLLGSADGAPCYLATVATWADDNRAPWSAPLHFGEGVSDHPPDNCQFPGKDGWVGGERVNVFDAIHNVTSILIDFAASASGSLSSVAGGGPPQAAQEALKFLIHFLGDMHQPLHLCGRDRGGNDYKVLWDGGVTRLHSVWDNMFIAKALQSTPANYSKPIRAPVLESSLNGATYDPYVRRIYWEGLGAHQQSGRWGSEVDSWLSCPPAPSFESVRTQLEQAPQQVLVGAATGGPPATSDSDTICPYAWAAPIHALNCGVVWPSELDEGYTELDTPEYYGKIAKDWVIEKLLMQGGVRLAGILNTIFAPQ